MLFRLLYYPMPTTNTPKLWVVDDDEDDQIMIRSAFNHASINVLTLDDGDQLLPHLQASDELPRLILLDINMTRQNGFETLRQLRSVPAYRDLPVVMLTTSSDEVDRQQCLALGANAFITKPPVYEQLTRLAHQLSQQWALA